MHSWKRSKMTKYFLVKGSVRQDRILDYRLGDLRLIYISALNPPSTYVGNLTLRKPLTQL